MRDLILCTFCNSGGNYPIVKVAPPSSQLGDSHDKSRQIRKIMNIPDEVTDQNVIHDFQHTVDITWLGGKTGRLEFDYNELGEGKIIRE